MLGQRVQGRGTSSFPAPGNTQAYMCPLIVESLRPLGFLPWPNLTPLVHLQKGLCTCCQKHKVPRPLLIGLLSILTFTCVSAGRRATLQDMQDSAELHRTVPSSCQRLQAQEPVSNHTGKFMGLQQELRASESEQSQVFLG